MRAAKSAAAGSMPGRKISTSVVSAEAIEQSAATR